MPLSQRMISGDGQRHEPQERDEEQFPMRTERTDDLFVVRQRVFGPSHEATLAGCRPTADGRRLTADG